MAKVRTVLELYGVLLLVAALSSFTVIQADDESAKSSEKDTSVVDDSSSQENSKEKRSREEILFGNQQNKPNGLVDDLMSMAEDEATKEDSKGSDKNQEGKGNEISSKEENDEKREAPPSDEERDMMASDSDSWYNTVPVSSTALQYLANAPALQSLPSQEFANTLYDQEDVYRRKRQLLGHPLPLRKRRSLRSSLGQMIQQRGLRMPRRSMRLKRQVDLYSLLGNDAFYEDQAQVSPRSFDGWENRVDKRHVPGHFISYQETPAPEYRYPFTFQHRDDGILNLGNEMEDNDENMEQGLTLEDLNDILTTHPKNQFPYRSQDEEGKAMQEWLARYTVPNTFRVARRSAPAFYPLDYRYIPGYKKRSPIFRNSNRIPSRYPSNAEEVEPDLGTWGHVVQVPEAYASPEDVARLYGLASLMAEGDDEAKAKRST